MNTTIANLDTMTNRELVDHNPATARGIFKARLSVITNELKTLGFADARNIYINTRIPERARNYRDTVRGQIERKRNISDHARAHAHDLLDQADVLITWIGATL